MITPLLLLLTIVPVAALAIALLLRHRESRRLQDAAAAAQERERDALIRLSAAEAHVAAAEQAAAAEKQMRERCEEQAARLAEQRTRAENELAALRAASQAEIAALKAHDEEQRRAASSEREEIEKRLREQFKNLANEILGEQSLRFRQTNKDSLELLLKPFRDNITDFRERVERIYSEQTEQSGALKNELRNLMELNRRITSETENLTRALRGNSKTQGDWGEMILETILDSSNLVKGVHYRTQVTIKDAEGANLRPDVVLLLPEGKRIVIDSKVSLTAYVGYCGAEEEAARRNFLAAHLQSVRQHVSELSRKEYQRLVDSPDFVVMFIPNEPAFLTALQGDAAIWNEAYERKVIISSPTNLFALLKLVDELWRRDSQNRNTADIVTYGTKLYEQLVNFTSALEGVGAGLDAAKERYNEAYKRLCTGNDNIVRSGERLRRLGLPTKKRHSARTLETASLPEDDPAPGDASPPLGSD